MASHQEKQGEEEIELPFQERIIPPSMRLRTITPEQYYALHRPTVEELERFWESKARELDWFKPWDRVLDNLNPPFYRWFIGGEINASYLAVDRHAKSWRRNKVAIAWEGEPWEGGPRETRKLTYLDLYREVNRAAYILKEVYGVRKGDRIGIYLPMIPELPIFMLASARIGAVFTVVFSGFSAQALSDRMNDAEAKVLITADGGWRRGKVIPLKEIVDRALESAPSVKGVLVVRRTGTQVQMREGRDSWYHEALSRVPENAYVEPERVRSEDPLYILYTSGTTGKPKGIVHDTGGYMVLLHHTMQQVFDVRDTDVYWCAADIGWVTGHSYIVFGPLMEGLTGVIYEGALDYPSPDRWASVLERHRVSLLYISPTAIRSFMRQGEKWVEGHDLSSVRLMHSVGEPINPEAWKWFHRNVGRGEVPFGSTWWMTETGGIMISITPGGYMVPMKPGTNGPPIPGISPEVVGEDGRPVPPGEKGYLVITKPWPGMPLTINRDPERYVKVYWSKFPGVFMAGDYAVKDQDGYFWILGRADEVLKIAGHRIGTYELESALVQHPAVAEAAVVGVPDQLRGEVAEAFLILRSGYSPGEGLKEEIVRTVRENYGSIAVFRDIHFVTKLPKTRSGKIMRRVIRATATDAPVGDITTLEDETAVDEVRKAMEEFKEEVRKSQK